MRLFGETVELWQADQPLGKITAITYLVDNQGLVRLAVLQSGNTTQKVWIQSSEEPFSAEATIDMEAKYDATVEPIPGVRVAFSEDRASILIEAGGQTHRATAAQIDELMDELAQFRRRLPEQVPLDPIPNSQIRGELDARWQLVPQPHKEVPGPLLLLRHRGFGWTAFHFLPK